MPSNCPDCKRPIGAGDGECVLFGLRSAMAGGAALSNMRVTGAEMDCLRAQVAAERERADAEARHCNRLALDLDAHRAAWNDVAKRVRRQADEDVPDRGALYEIATDADDCHRDARAKVAAHAERRGTGPFSAEIDFEAVQRRGVKINHFCPQRIGGEPCAVCAGKDNL